MKKKDPPPQKKPQPVFYGKSPASCFFVTFFLSVQIPGPLCRQTHAGGEVDFFVGDMLVRVNVRG